MAKITDIKGDLFDAPQGSVLIRKLYVQSLWLPSITS